MASDSRDGRIRTGALLLPKQADSQAFLHPDSQRSSTSAQRESNPHVRHGKAVGYRYIMGTIAVAELSRNGEHRVGLEPTSPPYEGGVFAARRPVPASRWDRRGSNPHQTGEEQDVLPLELRSRFHRESAWMELNLHRPVISRVFSR